MRKDELNFKDVEPLFEIGQIVKLKGNNEMSMVVADYAGIIDFKGEYACTFFDRVKTYNADGTAVEKTMKRQLAFHQDTLELVQQNL